MRSYRAPGSPVFEVVEVSQGSHINSLSNIGKGEGANF